VLDQYSLEDVIPFIDWNPFFQTWELRGKYPNRGYPRIFNDENVGGEARKLFDDAQAMLQDIVANKRLRLKGEEGVLPGLCAGKSASCRRSIGPGAVCLMKARCMVGQV
jgi:5-methyltetrahydrofolate--homocysteine methyltransferase